MTVILDECLPRRLKHDLVGHQVQTVPEAGLAGTKNGKLMAAIEGLCDCFLTIDAGIPYQQRLSASPDISHPGALERVRRVC